jgi:hypothetical protein
MKRDLAALFTCCLLALTQVPGTATLQRAPDDGLPRLLSRLEQLIQAGQPEAYLDLLGAFADRPLASAAARVLISPGVTRAVIRERDRAPLEGTLPGGGYRLMVEVFIEHGTRARVSTWQLDVRRITGDREDTWVIAGQQYLSGIDGLYRLSLNRLRQYHATNLVVRSEDLEVNLKDGYVFVAETEDGPTAAVLLPGSGASFRFKPTPQTEREQVTLYAGSDTIADEYDAMFMRFNPGEFAARFSAQSLREEAVDAGTLRRADTVFRDKINRSFSLDMGDLSRESWSLSPSFGDLLVEIRSRQFPSLTYSKSSNDAEDITVFDRRRRRNIAVYPSQRNIERNGRFFDEDRDVAFDVTDYLVEATFDPLRQTIQGRTRLRLTMKDGGLSSLTLKLADPFLVRSVFSPEFGRLLFLRVRDQNSLVINFPGVVAQKGMLTLVVEYGGKLEPSMVDREALTLSPQEPDQLRFETSEFPSEPNLLYTGRHFWYPQAPVSDYAPAMLRLTVPDGYSVLASGELTTGSPLMVPPLDGQKTASRLFVFAAPQPVRYLSCLISRLVRVDTRTVSLKEALATPGPDGPAPAPRPLRVGTFYDTLNLTVDTNPRQQARGRRMADTAQDIVRFYSGIVGDSPYPSLAIGLVEKDLPGGHSPAYLSVLYQPMPQGNYSWANDPAAFPNYPEFFVAHEIAHQWWGQAVAWRSYHEQWISEGFAQYFAALYAQRSRGESAFQDVIIRMARFAREQSAQGPVSLGYRLGHIKGDSRVFRALVYNKAAVVLHNLRLLLGDDVFFRGVRRFYADWRFRKACTADVQHAFETESGQDLEVFFEEWIHTSGVPVVKFSWAREGEGSAAVAVVRFEQVGTAFDMPIPVTVRYDDGSSEDVTVPVRARAAEVRIPLRGAVRSIDVNPRGTAIVEVYRN